jgi:hypothetical protein
MKKVAHPHRSSAKEGAKEGWRVDQSALGWASGSHSSVGG